MIKISAVSLLAFALFFTGCNFPLASPPTEPAIPTSLVIVPATPKITPSSTATIELTATPYDPLLATVNVDSLIVRTGPSKVFPVLHTYKENTMLVILGQAPGSGEWVLVQTPDHLAAWAMVEYIRIQGNLNSVPFVEPTDAYKIIGKILDENGDPVSGIGLAIYQGSGTSKQRADFSSDENGVFIGYLPYTATGSWTVGFVSIHCQASNIVDKDCNSSGSVHPETRTLTLPQINPLSFTWK